MMESSKGVITLTYADNARKPIILQVTLGRIFAYEQHMTGRDDSESSIAYMCLTFTMDTGELISMDSTGTQFSLKHESSNDAYKVNIEESRFRVSVWNDELDDNATAYWEITELPLDELEDDPEKNHFYKISFYNKIGTLVDDWYIDYNKPLTIEYQRCGVKIDPVLICG